MGTHEVDPGDGMELTCPLVEDELDVAERLEPGAEPRLRSSDPLGNRTYPPALERVEVEHAVGLAEPQRAQNDRFGLVTAARHPGKCRTAVCRAI
jgi:hypothetical protein